MCSLSRVQAVAAATDGYGAAMRVIVALLLCLFLVPGYAGEPRLPLLDPAHPVIVTRPVVLQIGDRRRTRLGRLIFLGGLQLTSPDPAYARKKKRGTV